MHDCLTSMGGVDRKARNVNRTLITGASILTMDSGLGELEGFDILIEGDTIVDINRNLAVPDAQPVDATGMIAMPGMIDTHRHVWEFIDIGRMVKARPAPFLPAYQQWKMRTIVSMTPEDQHLACYAGALNAIDTGVTTVVDYAHGQPTVQAALAAASGLKKSGIAGWFAFQMGVSSSYKPGETVSLRRAHQERIAAPSEQHWSTLARLGSEVFSDASAHLQLAAAPSGNNGSRISDIRSEWTRLRSQGIRLLAGHIHQPATPHPAGHMGARGSGIEDLSDADLLGPDYQVVHANSLTARELSMLRDAGCMLSATPMGEMTYVLSPKKGPPIHGRSMRAEVPTGIGIDVPLAVPCDYFEHIRCAYFSLYLDAANLDIAASATAHEVLELATSRAALACGCGERAGSLSPGKRADIVLLNSVRSGFGRAGTLAERVVMFASAADVDSVWIAGVPRKRHGALTGVNQEAIGQELARAQDRVGARARTITFVD